MSIKETLALSAVQGVTEFLPISSSGHLTLIQRLLGTENGQEDLLFTVILHLGTMMAIAYGLRHTIKNLSFSEIKTLALAILPLFPLLAIIGPLKALMGTDWGLGTGFIIGGCWILIGEWAAKKKEECRPITPKTALIVGVAQAVAILPGISRLGSTTATARILGWSRPQAVTFSLLIAIPTVLGGSLVEIRELILTSSKPMMPLIYYPIGFFGSLAVGLLALRLLLWISNVASFRPFGYYCIIIGIFALTYLR